MPDLPEKEILNRLFNEQDMKVPIIETEVEPKIDKEVEPYIQKLEKEIYLSKPITDDYGQPLVSAPSAQQPQITLPVSQDKYALGLTRKVSESIRWLAEWCLRIIKIFGSRTVFREERTSV